MIDEVLRFRQTDRHIRLSEHRSAYRGQILVDEKNGTRRTALAAGEALALRLGDTRTAPYAAGPMCKALLNSGRSTRRDPLAQNLPISVKMGRTDLASDSMIFQAGSISWTRATPRLSAARFPVTERLDDVRADPGWRCIGSAPRHSRRSDVTGRRPPISRGPHEPPMPLR